MNASLQKAMGYILNVVTILLIGTVLILPTFFTPVNERIVDRDKLTVDESMALFLMGRRSHLYHKANPEALPKIYRIFSVEEIDEFEYLRGRAIKFIGYAGGAEDVEWLRENLEADRHYRDIFPALAIMSKRGITEADELLSEYFIYETWEERSIQMVSDRYLEENPEARYSGPISAISAFAIYGDGEWQTARDELLASVDEDDAPAREYIISSLSEENINRRRERYRRRFDRPFTELDEIRLERTGVQVDRLKSRLEMLIEELSDPD